MFVRRAATTAVVTTLLPIHHAGPRLDYISLFLSLALRLLKMPLRTDSKGSSQEALIYTGFIVIFFCFLKHDPFGIVIYPVITKWLLVLLILHKRNEDGVLQHFRASLNAYKWRSDDSLRIRGGFEPIQLPPMPNEQPTCIYDMNKSELTIRVDTSFAVQVSVRHFFLPLTFFAVLNQIAGQQSYRRF